MEDVSKEIIDDNLTEEEMKSLKQIPSTPGLPYAGNALQVTGPGDMSRSMQRLGIELCPKYGGIFNLKLMGQKYVVISDPELVAQVFTGDNFGKKTETDAIFFQLRYFRFVISIYLQVVKYKEKLKLIIQR